MWTHNIHNSNHNISNKHFACKKEHIWRHAFSEPLPESLAIFIDNSFTKALSLMSLHMPYRHLRTSLNLTKSDWTLWLSTVFWKVVTQKVLHRTILMFKGKWQYNGNRTSLSFCHSPPWQRFLHVAPRWNPILTGPCAWPRAPGCVRLPLCCPCGWPGSLLTPRCHTVAWWHRSPLLPPVHGRYLFQCDTDN